MQDAEAIRSSKDLGQRVLRLRVARGWTQRELANRAQITQPRVSQIESGRSSRRLRLRTLRDLADAFGVDLDELIAGNPAYDLAEFGDAWSLVPPPTELTRSPEPLIGRTIELATIGALLRDQSVRLLTLVGPAGVGKTQLALHAIGNLEGEIPYQVKLVSLAPCFDAGAVVSALARALDIHERDTRPLRSRIRSSIGGDNVLLLLDNVEQVAPAVATLVAELLAACPNVRLLATGRAPLRLRDEQAFPVLPLALPDSADPLSIANAGAAPAIQLFLRRARAVAPGLSLMESNARDIVAICQRLDGLPLAIELAAARVRLLSPSQLARQLDRRTTELAGGARGLPPRQQSLRANIAWSFDLLLPTQQALMTRLAVFVSGFTLDAAVKVAGQGPSGFTNGGGPLADPASASTIADDVLALLDLHLLTKGEQADGLPRFAMLQTVHEFARDHLRAGGEADDLSRRHGSWAIEMAELADSALFGFDQDLWLDRLDAEWNNFRAALTWAIEARETEPALRLAAALTDYWYLRGMLSEGTYWLELALALDIALPMPRRVAQARVAALNGVSQLAQPRGDLQCAGSRAAQGLALAREIGDRRGEARALVLLGNHALVQDDLATAESRHRAALALFGELGGDHRWVVAGLNNLSLIAFDLGDNGTALACADEALARARDSGDAWGVAMAHQRLGDAALGSEQYARAANHFAQSLRQYRQQGLEWGVANAIAAGGSLAVAMGASALGTRLFAAAGAMYAYLGVKTPPTLRPDWMRMLDRALEDIGEDRFAGAWESGSRLTAEEAGAEALSLAVQAGNDALSPEVAAVVARRIHSGHANVLVRKSGTHPMRS